MPVRYLPLLVADWPDGYIAPEIFGATGTICYHGTDDPVDISEDRDGSIMISGSQLTVTTIGMVPGFWVQTEGVYEVDWVSGGYRIPLSSMQGLMESAAESASAAESSAGDASSSAEHAEAAWEAVDWAPDGLTQDGAEVRFTRDGEPRLGPILLPSRVEFSDSEPEDTGAIWVRPDEAMPGEAPIVVVHGDDPDVPRPEGAALVWWAGAAEPANSRWPDGWIGVG